MLLVFDVMSLLVRGLAGTGLGYLSPGRPPCAQLQVRSIFPYRLSFSLVIWVRTALWWQRTLKLHHCELGLRVALTVCVCVYVHSVC